MARLNPLMRRTPGRAPAPGLFPWLGRAKPRMKTREVGAVRSRGAAVFLGVVAWLLGPVPPALAQTSYPRFSAVLEVTDAAAGHRVGGNCPENTVATRVGDDLYFVYKTGGAEVGNQGFHYTVFVRRFHLDSFLADPAVRAFEQAEDGSGYDGQGYHDEPAILRNALGEIIPLHTWSGQTAACRGTATIPPRHRLIPDVDAPATWRPVGTDGTGLPSRVPNDHPHGAIFGDIMGAHDRPGGLSHFVGEGAFLQAREFAGSCGLGRYYYRAAADGSLDGPYLLVRADCGQPVSPAPPCYGGNVFTKGDVVVGRERVGPRSVHLVWNIRNTFMKDDPVCGCSCAAPKFYQWNYNLYYARSSDGGVTWSSLDGSRSQVVADPAPDAANEPLIWNDPGFLVHEGDVNQTSERSFDVDRDGRPVLVIKALVPGTGSYWPNRQTGHVDNADTARPPRYALTSRHWNGKKWIESVIDSTRDFFSDWVRVRVDRDDNIWVFAGGWPWASPTDMRPRYTVSRDGGATWEPWTPFLPESARLGYFYFYVDPLEPAYVYFAWVEDHRIKFVRIQISDTRPVPGEATGLVHAKLDATTQRIAWTPLPGDEVWYNLHRGSLAAIAGGAYDHRPVPSGCVTGGASLDVGDLDDGASRYYLVGATNLAVEGPLGSGTAGPRPPSAFPCP